MNQQERAASRASDPNEIFGAAGPPHPRRPASIPPSRVCQAPMPPKLNARMEMRKRASSIVEPQELPLAPGSGDRVLLGVDFVHSRVSECLHGPLDPRAAIAAEPVTRPPTSSVQSPQILGVVGRRSHCAGDDLWRGLGARGCFARRAHLRVNGRRLRACVQERVGLQR